MKIQNTPIFLSVAFYFFHAVLGPSFAGQVPTRHPVKLFVYASSDGKTLDCTRIGTSLVIPMAAATSDDLRFRTLDVESAKCDAGDYLKDPKTVYPNGKRGTQGVFLKTDSDQVYLVGPEDKPLLLGTVKLPLQKTNEVRFSEHSGATLSYEPVEGFLDRANSNRPTRCSVYETSLRLQGDSTWPWPHQRWNMNLANELYYCSSLGDLAGSWTPPRLRWLIVGD